MMRVCIFVADFLTVNLTSRSEEIAAMLRRLTKANIGVVFVVDHVDIFCRNLTPAEIEIHIMSIIREQNVFEQNRSNSIKHRLSVTALQKAAETFHAKHEEVALVSTHSEHLWFAKSLGMNFVLFLPENKNVIEGQKYQIINDLALLN